MSNMAVEFGPDGGGRVKVSHCFTVHMIADLEYDNLLMSDIQSIKINISFSGPLSTTSLFDFSLSIAGVSLASRFLQLLLC